MEFSQFFASPLHLNPAFAGSELGPRLTMNYRNQWPGIEADFSSYAISFDTYIKKMAGGLGIEILKDDLADFYQNYAVNIMYSKRIKIDRNFILQGSLQGGYIMHTLQNNSMVFPDMFESMENGFSNQTSVNTQKLNTQGNADFATGLVAFRDFYYAGFAVHHLSRPQFSENFEMGRIPVKYTINAGAFIPVHKRGLVKEDYSVSPNILFRKQGISEQINYGLYFVSKRFTAGAWFRQNFHYLPNSLILLAGYDDRKYRLSYSYDFSVAKFGSPFLSSHEISLTVLFWKAREGVSKYPKNQKKLQIPFF